MKPSKKFALNAQDFKSVIITLGLTVASFVLAQLIELLPSIDFGQHGEIVVIVLMTILKAGQKYFEGKK